MSEYPSAQIKATTNSLGQTFRIWIWSGSNAASFAVLPEDADHYYMMARVGQPLIALLCGGSVR